MSKLTIRNPTGEAVLTRVELDGEMQYVSDVAFHTTIDAYGRRGTLQATLVYPVMAVEVELDNHQPVRRYHARLFIPGYDGVSATGDGDTVADAIRDLATRVEA